MKTSGIDGIIRAHSVSNLRNLPLIGMSIFPYLAKLTILPRIPNGFPVRVGSRFICHIVAPPWMTCHRDERRRGHGRHGRDFHYEASGSRRAWDWAPESLAACKRTSPSQPILSRAGPRISPPAAEALYEPSTAGSQALAGTAPGWVTAPESAARHSAR